MKVISQTTTDVSDVFHVFSLFDLALIIYNYDRTDPPPLLSSSKTSDH